MPRNKTADDSEKKVHKDSSEKLYEFGSGPVKYSGYPLDRLANRDFDPKRLKGSLANNGEILANYQDDGAGEIPH